MPPMRSACSSVGRGSVIDDCDWGAEVIEPRQFRLIADGVRYRIQVLSTPWWGFKRWGQVRWRRTFTATFTSRRWAEDVMCCMMREEEARIAGYHPLSDTAWPPPPPPPPSSPNLPNCAVRLPHTGSKYDRERRPG